MRFYFQLCLLLALLVLVYSTHQQQSNNRGDDESLIGRTSIANNNGGRGRLSPHAKEVLLEAARERLTELQQKQKKQKQKQQQQNDDEAGTRSKTSSSSSSPSSLGVELPPLESLVDMKNGIILQDVQFLLDFAVVGFGKCGTTTLLQWLTSTSTSSASASSTNTTTVAVRAPNYEAQFLVNQRPEQLVRKMHQFGIEEQEIRWQQQQQQQTGTPFKIFKGFKNPSDIRRQKSRDLLKKYWPKTPLVVTVRHPVHWLVSIYNYYKIEKGRSKAKLSASDVLDRGGRDVDGNTQHYVSTAKGEFHAMLAELGKTPLVINSPEMKLLQPWLDLTTQRERIVQHRLPNPIFFMEMGQLVSSDGDNNTTRSKQFANDLESFLGFPPNHLPSMAPHVRPRSDSVSKKVLHGGDTSHLKMNICEDQYQPVLEEMVKIGRSASTWFQEYFIKSPDVTVSNPDHLIELLERWKINPCNSNNNEEEEKEE